MDVDSGARFAEAISGETYHEFICYSGIIDESPILLYVARQNNIETVCLEGWAWRTGHMVFNFNAPALEYDTGCG